MNEQLSLDSEVPAANPNAWMFNADGTPRKLLWCSDSVRIAWRKGLELSCPYEGERARFMPGGVCCKDVERGIA